MSQQYQCSGVTARGLRCTRRGNGMCHQHAPYIFCGADIGEGRLCNKKWYPDENPPQRCIDEHFGAGVQELMNILNNPDTMPLTDIELLYLLFTMNGLTDIYNDVKVTYENIVVNELNESDIVECGICDQDGMVTTVLGCVHLVCRNCVKRIIEIEKVPKCPYCRLEIDETKYTRDVKYEA